MQSWHLTRSPQDLFKPLNCISVSFWSSASLLLLARIHQHTVYYCTHFLIIIDTFLPCRFPLHEPVYSRPNWVSSIFIVFSYVFWAFLELPYTFRHLLSTRWLSPRSPIILWRQILSIEPNWPITGDPDRHLCVMLYPPSGTFPATSFPVSDTVHAIIKLWDHWSDIVFPQISYIILFSRKIEFIALACHCLVSSNRFVFAACVVASSQPYYCNDMPISGNTQFYFFI